MTRLEIASCIGVVLASLFICTPVDLRGSIRGMLIGGADCCLNCNNPSETGCPSGCTPGATHKRLPRAYGAGLSYIVPRPGTTLCGTGTGCPTDEMQGPGGRKNLVPGGGGGGGGNDGSD